MSGGEPITVLYVDDDPEFGDLVAYWLDRDEGEPPVTVRQARDPETAAATVAEEAIDCVVADYAMPDTDGIALLETLRERGADVPFVLFTAHGGPETAREAFRAGATDYMAKAGDRGTIGVLAERIRAIVRGRRASRRSGDDRSGRRADNRRATPDDGRPATPDDGVRTSERLADQTGAREAALDAATSLMSATPDELDAKIRFTLQSLCEHLEVGRAAVYLEGDDGYERHHDHPEGGLPMALEDAGTDQWIDRLEAFETVRYGPDETHPTADRVAGPGDRSGVAAPMVADWRLAGAVVFDAPDERPWTDEEVRLLETVTTLTTRSLERRDQARELRRQNDRLEQFASVVSHDLRNPINVADGWLELAREGDEEAFDRVQNAIDRMEQLTEDVLTLARDGADVGETEPVAVRQVARRAWDRVDTAEASLRVDSVGEVDADEGRLAAVFENLFRNSVEHGGNDVTVRVGGTPDGFFVADDGPGLPDDPDRLFEWGTTTDDGGSGLGLAIVDRVADGHDWDVSAHDDDGARFEFHT